MKAQQVKNAVIVPVGAKGGFVPKLMPKGATRDVVQAEGVATYKLFISSLLDITDNIGSGRQDHSARGCGSSRGRRPVSRGRRRQGHRDILRHRERDLGRARFLAGRCLRVGRLGRLRPQGHGHHRARRLGSCEAAFPRDGCRYRQDAIQRGRRRRHVGRRVRQRHAARGHDQAAGCVRSPRHFHRSGSRSEKEFRRAQAAVRAAALELAGL